MTDLTGPSRNGSRTAKLYVEIESKVHEGHQAPGIVRTLAAVGSWFAFNISMGSLTKWTYLYGQVCFKDARGCVAYTFPLFITAVHMLVCWTICFVIIWRRKEARHVLSWSKQLAKIVPLAIVFSSSIAMGNLSLKYIYPSFNQMLASVSPLLTVLVSMTMQGKRYNSWTWISMPVICGGLLLCSFTEVNYNTLGTVFVFGATLLRAVKSVMQEKLLDPKERSFDSVTLLAYFSPWAGAFCLSMSLCFEGLAPVMLLLPSGESGAIAGVEVILFLLLMSGVNAAFLNLSANLLTSYVGAVMLQILGNVKACIAILVSVAIFRNPVTMEQVLGVTICLSGVFLYQQKGGSVKRVAAAM